MAIQNISGLPSIDFRKISGERLSATVSGVSNFGSPTILRLSIASDGDSWNPRLEMEIGTGVIDWGDGTPTEEVQTTLLPAHNYATAGTYNVTLTPFSSALTRIVPNFASDPNETQVNRVMAFGDCGKAGFRKWTALQQIPLDGHLELGNLTSPFWDFNLFSECSSFVGPTVIGNYCLALGPAVNMGGAFRSTPFNRSGFSFLDTSAVTNFFACFDGSSQSVSGPEDWDTSSGEFFGRMFANCPFNRDLSGYDMSSATNINSMFNGASSFQNGGVNNGVGQGLDTWDVSNVVDMADLFSDATSFNSRLDSWTINPSVTSLARVFRNCDNFDNGGASGVNVGIDNWNVSNVNDFTDMFLSVGSNNKDGFYLGSWDTSSAIDMPGMFQGSNIGETNASGIGGWNVGNVEDFSGMFKEAKKFNEDIGSWNTSSALDMSLMFDEAVFFNNGAAAGTGNNGGVGIGIDNWDVSNVTNMSQMFQNSPFFSWYIGSWDVSNVTDMKQMFKRAYALWSYGSAGTYTLGIENWNTGNVTDMEEMFFGITNIQWAAINTWDVRKVTNFKNFGLQSTPATRNALDGWQLDSAEDMELAADSMIAPDVATTLVAWDNYVNTNTNVNATQVFGNLTMSIGTYSSAKAAYDRLTDSIANGGRNWTLTGITWVA